MKAYLSYPANSSGYANIIQAAAWSSLPIYLKKRFKRDNPLYRTSGYARISWGGYFWTINSGFFFDGASIPLVAKVIGFSRFTANMELYPASLFHDAGARGVLPRLVHKNDGAMNDRVQMKRYNDLYYALGIAAGYPRWKMAFQKRILDVIAETASSEYMRFDDYPDPTLVQVIPIINGVEPEYTLDWLTE